MDIERRKIKTKLSVDCLGDGEILLDEKPAKKVYVEMKEEEKLGSVVSDATLDYDTDCNNINYNKHLYHKPTFMMLDSRICRDFIRGNCKRGPLCKFLHQYTTLNSQNILSDNILCRDYQSGVCSRGPSCRYQHVIPESCAHDEESGMMMLVTTSSMAGQQQQQSSLTIASSVIDCQSLTKTPTIPAEPSSLTTNSTNTSEYLTAYFNPATAFNITANSNIPGNMGDKVIPVCRDYMKGKCERGFRCRFRHITMADYNASLSSSHSGGPHPPLTQNVDHSSFTLGSSNNNYNNNNFNRECFKQFTAAVPPTPQNTHNVNSNQAFICHSAASLPISSYVFHPLSTDTFMASACASCSSYNAGVISDSISLTPRPLALTSSSALPMALSYVVERPTVEHLLLPPHSKRRLLHYTPPDAPVTATLDTTPNKFTDEVPKYFLSTAQDNFDESYLEDDSDIGIGVKRNQSPKFFEQSRLSNTIKSINKHQYQESVINRNNSYDKSTTISTSLPSNSSAISHSEKALVEENESLKQRLDTLKKQIAELNATVDMLLEQNRRLRLCGMGGGIVPSGGIPNNTNNQSLMGNVGGHTNATSIQLGQATAHMASAVPAPLTLLATPSPQPLMTPHSTILITPPHSFHHTAQLNGGNPLAFNSFTVVSGVSNSLPGQPSHINGSIQVVPCLNQSPQNYIHHSTLHNSNLLNSAFLQTYSGNDFRTTEFSSVHSNNHDNEQNHSYRQNQKDYPLAPSPVNHQTKGSITNLVQSSFKKLNYSPSQEDLSSDPISSFTEGSENIETNRHRESPDHQQMEQIDEAI